MRLGFSLALTNAGYHRELPQTPPRFKTTPAWDWEADTPVMVSGCVVVGVGTVELG